MNKKHNNIFKDLIINEDTNTILLKNFLRFKMYRTQFLEIAELKQVDQLISYSDISTQVSHQDTGRPDLVIKNKQVELFFEVKVQNSPLTFNQPINYYKYLRDTSKATTKALVFIIPHFYIGKYEYENRLDSIYNIDDNIIRKTLTWDEIFGIVKGLSKEENNILFQEYECLLEDYFKFKPIIFNEIEINTMFNTQTAKGISKLFNLVGTFNYFQSQNLIIRQLPDYRTYGSDGTFGVTFYHPNYINFDFFIGIWSGLWEEEGVPICFSISKHSDLDSFFVELVKKLELPEPFSYSEDDENEFLVTYFNEEFFNDETKFKEVFSKITLAFNEVH
jgi:hypothetical protein